MRTTTHDIIIIGGGMTGLALACMLAQKTSLTIAVLERQSSVQAWSDLNYHHRVSAITLSSQKIFQSLNVWDDIQAKRVSPFRQIEVWDAPGGGEIIFNSREIAASCLGYIIENNLIQTTLEEKIRQYPNVEMISPIVLERLIESENKIEFIATDGRAFTSKLAIAADGANSWLRQQAGMNVEKMDYHQQAIVATVHTALSHHETARQVFLATGPLAFLPLSEKNTSSIVWSLPAENAKQLMDLEPHNFQLKLGEAFEYRLGDILKIEQRYSFPLSRQNTKHYVKPGIVLTGDAAHTVHPLAGQGVNMGLLDAASLTDVIVSAIKNNRDFSSYTTLRQYERWRKADNLSMCEGIDILKNLFASEKKSVQVVRSLGLDAVNRMKWMKNCFARHAVGERDGLPSMAR